LPETKVAEQAYRFAAQIEPAFVFAHGVRSYHYARVCARSRWRRIAQDQAAERSGGRCGLRPVSGG